MEDELYDFLYRTVFTAVIALFIFLEVYDYVDPGLITRGNVFAVIAVSISFNALLLLYRRVRMYMIPAVLLVGIILYFLIDRNDVVMIIESVVFSIMMISLASFVLFLICDRVPVLNMIVAGGAFIYMIVQLFTGYGLHKASPALVMFYVLAVLTGITRNGIRRILPENARRARQYMTFLIPFLLAFLLLLVVFPKPKNPISWKWVQNLYEYTSDKIETLMHRFSSKYGHVTTSGSFKIAFDVSERMDYDNTGAETIELMEITPDSTVFGGLYLKGEIFNEFKDGQWFNTLESDKDYSRIDAFESYYGVTVYSGLSVNSLLREASVQIRFLDISSPIVFAPVKMNVLRDISVKKDTEYLNEHLLFSGNVSYGSAYSISFLQMNLGNTVFNDYMNSAAAPFDNESFETARKNLRGNYRDMSPELLEEYHDYVKRYYMSTPQIRDSVKEWLEEITTAGLTDYEKLLAVERALASLEYNLNTKAIPDYVQTEGDFINHFILEKREGFCVHYATVFCLLARYMGYPARVIRGYKTQTVYNETTVVNNSCGHAWPEVYFEGRGWIPFEPTPGMAVERYAGWTVKSGKLKDEDTFRAGKQDNVPALPEEDVEYEREHIESKVSGILVFTIFAIIITSLVMLLAARFLIGRRRLKSMDEQERYYLEFDRLLLILAQLGIRKETQETLSEYIMRLEQVLENAKEEALDNLIKNRAKTPRIDSVKNIDIAVFGRCIENHELCLYGGKLPTHKEVLGLGRCEVEAEKLLKQKFGRAFILYKLKMFILYGF